MLRLTLYNYDRISNNQNVLDLVKKCLENNEQLVAGGEDVGEFVCSCDIGTVQRVNGKFFQDGGFQLVLIENGSLQMDNHRQTYSQFTKPSFSIADEEI